MLFGQFELRNYQLKCICIIPRSPAVFIAVLGISAWIMWPAKQVLYFTCWAGDCATYLIVSAAGLEPCTISATTHRYIACTQIFGLLRMISGGYRSDVTSVVSISMLCQHEPCCYLGRCIHMPYMGNDTLVSDTCTHVWRSRVALPSSKPLSMVMI